MLIPQYKSDFKIHYRSIIILGMDYFLKKKVTLITWYGTLENMVEEDDERKKWDKKVERVKENSILYR